MGVKLPSGSWRRTASKPGISDLMCLVNVGKFKGLLLAIEVKSPTGKLSPPQKEFGRKIEANGGRFLVARSPEDVEKCLLDLKSE